MPKLLRWIAFAATAILIGFLCFVSFVMLETGLDDSGFDGLLLLGSLLGVTTAVARYAWPSRRTRLENELAAALANQRLDGVREGAARPSPQLPIGRRLLMPASRRSLTIGVAFLIGGTLGAAMGLEEEELALALGAVLLLAAALAALWRTDALTRLEDAATEAELEASLEILQTAPLPGFGDHGPSVTPSTGGGEGRRPLQPPPLPTTGTHQPLAISQPEPAVPVASPNQQRQPVGPKKPRFPLGPRSSWRNLVAGLIFPLLFVSWTAKLKGTIVFTWGLGTLLAAVLVSVPAGLLLKGLIRLLWRRHVAYAVAFKAHFGGATLGMAVPFLADAYFGTSLLFPILHFWLFCLATVVLPPIVWAEIDDLDGAELGYSRAYRTGLAMLPFGLAFGYVWARLHGS